MGYVVSSRFPRKDDSELFYRASTFSKGNLDFPDTVNHATIPAGVQEFQETMSYRTEGYEPIGSEEFRQSNRTWYNPFDSQYDKGHDFWTYHRTVDYNPLSWRVPYSSSSDYKYEGPGVIYGTNSYPTEPVRPLDRMSSSFVTAQGQRLIVKASPITPEASLGAFLGELREGLPALMGLNAMRHGASVYKGLGSEYLNVQFGWKPFISEIKAIMRVVSNSTRRLSQLQRDSGRVVRRKFWEHPVTSIDFSSQQMYPSPLMGMSSSQFVTLFGAAASTEPASLITRLETKLGFAGAMTYYTDVGNGVLDNMVEFQRKADAFLGATLNPTVLWELAPWSWLIDWISNIGDSIAVSDQIGNGLVLRYGYLMRETRRETLLQTPSYVTRAITLRPGSGGVPLQLSNLYHEVLKERVRANPFGFALQVDEFSSAQWAILAALGMTRAPRVLA